jgi:hypothetical protein
MDGMLDKLHQLELLLEENQPASADLYVDAPSSVVTAVVRDIQRAPNASKKHLLFGARGGGKSTQLGEIYRRLDGFLRLDLDLDRMGIEPARVTAFDLLYMVGLSALKALLQSEKKLTEELYEKLCKAYGVPSKSGGGQTLQQAVAGLAGFGEAVGKVATAVGLIAAPVLAVGAGLTAVSAGMRLLLRSNPAGLVSANSQEGRGLQVAVQDIFVALRKEAQRVVVLIDGLEKVNGQAAQWFRDTFENTSLLSDAEVTMVLASPPCPFSHTNAASHYGYVIHVLYGYGTADLGPLTQLLRRRVERCGLSPDDEGFAAACRRFARDSGGHPRWAVMLLKRAVQSASYAGRETLVQSDLDTAVRQVLETSLAIGLTENEYRVMLRVAKVGQLPDADVAARLFSDGRVLADPPDETGTPQFQVHPLLEPALERYRDAVKGEG